MADDTPKVEEELTDDNVDGGDGSTSPVSDNPAIASVFAGIDGASVVKRSYASSEASYYMASVGASQWVDAVVAAKSEGFDFFIDLYAADHFRDAPRFEVGINLLNTTSKLRLIISTRLPYDAPSIPTVTDVFAGANFYEREAYDLFGIEFVDHPDLTRILLPDDWDGYPLRKDYAIGAIPVQFKAGSVDL